MITGGGQEFGLRSGTENVPAVVGFGRAVEVADALREKESLRVGNLRDRLLRGLKKIHPKLLVNGSMKDRLPNNLNVTFVDQNAHELVIKLDLNGVAVSSGSACSARTSRPSHVLVGQGGIRFSLGRGTTKKEIDFVFKIISSIMAV
jgi:cysteine desulfurase